VQYWMAGRMLYEFGRGDNEELRSEARERRKWVNRVSELRTGGKLSIGRCFLLFFSSLLFSSAYFITSLDLGPVLMASARVLPPPDLSQWEVEFPHAPDPPKGHPERLLIGSGTFELVRVRTRHDCLMLSFPFLFSYTVYAAQEVCA